MTSTVVSTQALTGDLLRFHNDRATPDVAVTIVVPCYNEAKRLNVPAFVEYLNSATVVSFVFVDDGSKDGTLDVLKTIHAVYPDRVQVLALHENSGKAEAVRQGLIYAIQGNATFVGYWDADLATPLNAINDFVTVGTRYEDVDVIFGARRMLLGHRVERSLPRRIVSRICASLARVAVRLPIGDTQCGAKLLRNSPNLLRALQSPFSAGWLFDVELFTRVAANSCDRGSAFYEYPLAEWTEVEGSNVSAKAILRSGLSMLRLIAEARFGLPSPKAQRTTTAVSVITMTADISQAA